MILKNIKKSIKNCLLLIFLGFNLTSFCQDSTNVIKPKVAKNEFWKRVQFGGGLGLNIGTGFTDISVSPSAIYHLNNYVSLGTGLQVSYISVKNRYNSFIYGASLIALVNPIDQIQLSIELEELKVNTSFESNLKLPANRFWNTGLFIGAGYRTNNVTIGARYNVLYKESDQVYNNAFMPFVRVYF